MRVLVGSKAITLHYPDFPRLPRDTDFFIDHDKYVENHVPGLEYFFSPPIMNWLRSYGECIPLPSGSSECYYAGVNELYTIKVSHAFWDLKNHSWEKHMFDAAWLKDKGAVLIEDFYHVLYSTWEEHYGEKKANLNVSAEEFFNGNVKRVYEHDSIHESIAYGDEPLFNRILREDSEVAVDRRRFEALSWDDKARLVREEVYATALERVLIPNDYTGSPGAAYGWALKKLITSFSKGWFPLWIVQNYKELRKPDCDFVQKHKLNSNKLILLED